MTNTAAWSGVEAIILACVVLHMRERTAKIRFFVKVLSFPDMLAGFNEGTKATVLLKGSSRRLSRC